MWDTSDLEALIASTRTPFARPDPTEQRLTEADPLAASRAFASRPRFDSAPSELTEEWAESSQRRAAEYEVVVDKIPNHAFQEALRNSPDGPLEAEERDWESGPTLHRADGEPPYAAEEFDVPFADMRQRAVKAAKDERDRWHNGKLTEYTTGDGKEIVEAALREYWSTVPGHADITQLIQTHAAWSAAFISTVMQRAGAGESFQYTDAHCEYVAAAKQARMRGDATKLWAYRMTETKPELGDILCAGRIPQGSNACSGITYDNVDDGKTRAAHGDIVVGVSSNSIDVIGGNVSNSIKQQSVTLDANGPVVTPNGCPYFAIVKSPGSVVAAVSPTAATIKHVLDTLGSLPVRVASAVHNGVITVEAGLALARGERDEGKLTNLIFAARHPELPAGYTIKARDRDLAQDWLRIRDTIVRPVLRTF